MKFFRKKAEIHESDRAGVGEPLTVVPDSDDLDDSAFARAIAEGREREQFFSKSA